MANNVIPFTPRGVKLISAELRLQCLFVALMHDERAELVTGPGYEALHQLFVQTSKLLKEIAQ